MAASDINNILSIQNLSRVGQPVNHFNNFTPSPFEQLHLQLQLQQQLHQQQVNQLHHPHPNQQSQQSQSLVRHHHKKPSKNNIIATNGRSHYHTPKKELIDLVTCKLCKGYLIDAATLDLCMHSFCRPCAVKYIREKPRCPECNLEIKDKRSLNRLKLDFTLQNIVYKLVPGLYEKEMARRRKFYATRPSTTARYKSEMFGDIPPSKTIKPDDMLNVSITWSRDSPEEQIKTYLHCRADSTMLVLRKLIVGKFGLERPIKIYYGNSEIFFDLTTLMDVAATYNWAPENKVMNLCFKEEEEEEEEKKIQSNSLLPMNSALVL